MDIWQVFRSKLNEYAKINLVRIGVVYLQHGNGSIDHSGKMDLVGKKNRG